MVSPGCAGVFQLDWPYQLSSPRLHGMFPVEMNLSLILKTILIFLQAILWVLYAWPNGGSNHTGEVLDEVKY